MPFTMLHYSLAYTLRKALKRAGVELDMASLVVGSFAPDLECPLIFVLSRAGLLSPDELFVQRYRLVLHSVIGSLALGALVSIPIVLALYRLFEEELRGLGRPGLAGIYASSALGALSHALLDALHHDYNPLLFPFTLESVDVLVPLGDRWLGAIVAHSIAIPLCAIAVIMERRAGSKLLVRLVFDA